MARPRKKSAEAIAVVTKTIKGPVVEEAAPKSSAEVDVTITLQLGNSEWDITNCKGKVLEAIATSENGKEIINSLALYIKPEDAKIYFVANKDITGSIDM